MSEPDIVLYGAQWCPDCRRSKAFLSEQRIDFTYVDIEAHPEGIDVVLEINGGKQIIPTIVFADGTFLAEPTNEELAEKVGLKREAVESTYDVVIVGGGPTGLTTAIYCAREDFRSIVVEQSALGGQASVTERFDNYPGFPEGIKGSELAERFALQAQRYGVELLPAVSVESIESADGAAKVTLSTGQVLSAGAVLVATGSTYRRTGAPGEADLIGSGVHFCATCDGPFYRDAEELVVLGGGNSGLEEGLFLTKFGKHVTVIERGATLKGSRILQAKVEEHPQMSILTQVNVTSFNPTENDKLKSITLTSDDGKVIEHHASGAFVFIGLSPNTEWLDGLLALDSAGFIETDRMMATSQLGVFAAGDVRSGSTKQLASAVGEGAAVALQIRYHLEAMREG